MERVMTSEYSGTGNASTQKKTSTEKKGKPWLFIVGIGEDGWMGSVAMPWRQ
jgi:precorrin-6Y C5,15-methyltransferase (decarboxylating)